MYVDVAVALGVAENDAVALGECVGVPEVVGVNVDVAVALGVADEDAVALGVADDDSVALGECVDVPEVVGVNVDVVVSLGVAENDAVALGENVGVPMHVSVPVDVSVTDGVTVGEAVGDCDGVAEGVAEAEGVDVAEGQPARQALGGLPVSSIFPGTSSGCCTAVKAAQWMEVRPGFPPMYSCVRYAALSKSCSPMDVRSLAVRSSAPMPVRLNRLDAGSSDKSPGVADDRSPSPEKLATPGVAPQLIHVTLPRPPKLWAAMVSTPALQRSACPAPSGQARTAAGLRQSG